jgi:uncharacterized membrane protein
VPQSTRGSTAIAADWRGHGLAPARSALDDRGMSYWPLLGIGVVIIGFAVRANPVLVVMSAAITTGVAARLDPLALLELIGGSFLKNRYLPMFILILPVIGLMEKHGLRDHARRWISSIRVATAARLLFLYFVLRQGLSAIGMYSLGGQAQTVRPLMAPMAEAAAEKTHGPLPAATRDRLKALTAGTDNIAMFFGEDIFLAFGAVLIIQSFYRDNGISLDPVQIAQWAIPTALAALVIHGVRLWRLEERLAREATRGSGERPPPGASGQEGGS